MPITKELIPRVKELGKNDKQPLMENMPIFEWIPGNIILENHENKEFFDNLINDLQNHHNDYNDSNYVSDDSDEDSNSLW